ncbi:hypothetical protein PHYSODRAFT_518367 [Phytophthora sojae]|uniref:Uncharacterized protein n=1 Tax=Phytophthora sojae (strain P6497) TaxID=1094619 RepID=G5A142_PHYSP|nr:hypothetical protein PHYSODRAFT_518367 [Phytophthora sojae]EGZ10644.1 hypothetical protein PHYSODRAFT_518367 [Phytophthora sojae]|eukprot:XP_009533389.1 hypothetical protein PHYSODRAFT_518367 [Phytophthora sojae]
MPSTRYIYADLDALNQDVCAYMRSHSKDFSSAELSKHSPISAYKLTELLPKSASKHRTLGHLPKPKRSDTTDEMKTLVLVAGKLAVSVLHGVDKYFEAGWRVQCYCFRDRDAKVYDLLAAENPSHFQCTYVDSLVRGLIKEISGDYEMMVTAKAASRHEFPVGDAMKTSIEDTRLNCNLPSLYEHIHELQEKVFAMEVDSENQRYRQHEEMMLQLQQQKEAFEYQLHHQDEEFQTRLSEHLKSTTFLHQRHEQLVDKHMKACSSEVAAALSSIEELSECVKQDMYEYQRSRLDKELTRWRRETATTYDYVTKDNDQVNSTLLDAVDDLLKQNEVQSGIKNWRAALVVLIIHKVTAWLSTSSFGVDLIGILATSVAVVAIASCFIDQ